MMIDEKLLIKAFEEDKNSICSHVFSHVSVDEIENLMFDIEALINNIQTKTVKTHELKTLPEFFEAQLKGIKKFEVRVNDQDYQVGDILVLQEYNPKRGYTGKYLHVEITYILDNTDFCKENYVVLGTKLRLDRGIVL